jgi:hypothetical protein
MTQPHPALDLGPLVAALQGVPSPQQRRAREISESLIEHPDVVTGLQDAVWKLVEINRDAVRDGLSTEQFLGLHAAASERRTSTHLALTAGAAVRALSTLIRDLAEQIDAHTRNLGFTAPELIAEKQEQLIRSIREQLTERGA